MLVLKWTFAVIALAAGAMLLIFWLARSHQSEVLLSSGVALTPEWQTITSPHMLLTEEPWSEVLIEMPTLSVQDAVGDRLGPGGTSLTVDAYLVTDDAKEIKLYQAGTDFSKNVVLRFSNGALQWKTRDYRFRALALRSNRPVQTGKVLWMSYDPRDTKDGEAFPRALQ